MVVNGIDKTHYAPNSNMTRAEFTTALVRALGLSAASNKSHFEDIRSEEWYNEYIETAYVYGLLSTDDLDFNPNELITREDAIVMIANAMKYTEIKTSVSSSEATAINQRYSDLDEASLSAQIAIRTCIKAGIITGRTETTLEPASHITRAEVAVIIEKLLKKSNLI